MFSRFRNLFFARGDTKGLNTVGLTGDLERLVGKRLKSSGIDPAWALLQRIDRDHSGSKDGIDRETTFFAKYAKPREAESG